MYLGGFRYVNFTSLCSVFRYPKWCNAVIIRIFLGYYVLISYICNVKYNYLKYSIVV